MVPCYCLRPCEWYGAWERPFNFKWTPNPSKSWTLNSFISISGLWGPIMAEQAVYRQESSYLWNLRGIFHPFQTKLDMCQPWSLQPPKRQNRLGIWTKTTSSTCSWLICWSFAEPDHRRHEMHKRSRGTKPQAHGRWGYKNHQGISWKFKGTPAIATETRPF